MSWIKFALLLLVLVAVCVLAEDIPSKKYGKGRAESQSDEETRYSSKKSSTKKVRVKTGRKPMLSAWGIVFLILTFVFLGVAAYYFYLFYPIYFKKPRQYDNIELVTVKV